MTLIKLLAAHEVVRAAFPRPVTERDEVGMAVGRAIDGALARYSFEQFQGRRPTATAMNRLAAEIFDEELANADLSLTTEERAGHLAASAGVIHAFRRSELMGLIRPRSRIIVLNRRAGIYAQPDFWDGRARFYEMKSYRANPVPPDIRLQVQLFQCAYPSFRAFLAWFDRHATPVTATIEEVPLLEPATQSEVLQLAYRTALESGVEKVLEFVDGPMVHYSVPE